MEEEKEEAICVRCGDRPCSWIVMKRTMEEHANSIRPADDMDGDKSNELLKTDRAKLRKALYRLYVYEIYGHLGRGNRVCIPVCVRDQIRAFYPDPDDEYMGHMSE